MRATSTRRDLGRTTFAMKYAIGTASTPQMTVTDAAMPTVRMVTRVYAGSVKTSLKFCRVNWWMTAFVNSSTLNTDVASSENSAAKYTTNSHVSGSASRIASRVRGLRKSRAESRRRLLRGSGGAGSSRVSAVIARSGLRQLLRRLLHAFAHSEYGSHFTSVRPSRHSLCGVVQNQ